VKFARNNMPSPGLGNMFHISVMVVRVAERMFPCQRIRIKRR
jgi:hypothetical protein